MPYHQANPRPGSAQAGHRDSGSWRLTRLPQLYRYGYRPDARRPPLRHSLAVWPARSAAAVADPVFAAGYARPSSSADRAASNHEPFLQGRADRAWPPPAAPLRLCRRFAAPRWDWESTSIPTASGPEAPQPGRQGRSRASARRRQRILRSSLPRTCHGRDNNTAEIYTNRRSWSRRETVSDTRHRKPSVTRAR